MSDLWEKLKRLERVTLQTERGKSFDVISVDRSRENGAVIVEPNSSRKQRPIARSCFDDAQALGLGTAIRPIDVKDSGASDWNPTYVAAILKAVSRD